MTYKLTMSGSDLHHYGQGVYGWGKFSTVTGKPGVLVQFFLRTEAEKWVENRKVFCSGARVVSANRAAFDLPTAQAGRMGEPTPPTCEQSESGGVGGGLIAPGTPS